MKLERAGDKARDFPCIEDPARVTHATIWHCNYRTMADLAKLTNLRSLRVATFPDTSFNALSSLSKLRRLEVWHLPRVSELDALSNCSALRELTLATLPSWDSSGKMTTLNTLEPLSNLPELRKLVLRGIRVAHGGLRPLHVVARLKSLEIANVFGIEELAALRVAKPRLRCESLSPTVTIRVSLCKKCGKARVMLNGVEKFAFKCPRCQQKRVQAHLQQWATALDKTA